MDEVGPGWGFELAEIGLRVAESGIRSALRSSAHLAHSREPAGEWPRRPFVWAHAASGGDVRALAVTLARLRREAPHVGVALTTMTETGFSAGLDALRGGVVNRVAPAPVGQPAALEALLRAGPSALLLERAELWPGMLAVAGRRHLPVVVHNGRVSRRSAGFYRSAVARWPSLARSIRAAFVLTDADAERFASFLPSSAAIAVAPSSKLAGAAPDPAAVERLRAAFDLPDGRSCLVAGSVRIAEVQALCAGLRGRRLVVAPRYPADAPAALDICRAAGLDAAPTSERRNATALVVNAFGDLPAYYALAEWALVGGTLEDLGGHNPVEAFAAGAPVVVGPSTHAIDPLLAPFADIDAAVVRVGRDSTVWPERPGARPEVLRARLRSIDEAIGADAVALLTQLAAE